MRTERTPPEVSKFDSSRSDFMPYGFTCELWTPTLMSKPDRHNEVELNYLPSGTLTYLIGGRVTTVESRRLVLFWAAMPHQILKWDIPHPYYVATLPLAWFLSCGFPEQFAHPILAGEILSDLVPRAGDEARLKRWVRDFRSAQVLRQRAAELEIHARLLRSAVALRDRTPDESSAKRPRVPEPSLSRADQLASYIARYYVEPLTTERIAKAVGLHPNYAMNLFRKTFGITMVDFLLQHRLSHAQRLLITSDDPVIEVAAAAGFQSLSRFNEAFKKACGCPPREYRKAHGSVVHPPPLTHGGSGSITRSS